MKKKITEMPSSLPGLMASGGKFHFSINTRMELTESINPVILEHAVEQARWRYPYYYTHLVREEGELLLEDNPAPVVVCSKPIPPMLLSEESNGHIQAFSCDGSILWHHIHHAFTDGKSLYQYLHTVMYLYFSEKYHRDFCSPGVHLPGEPILPEETIDPQLAFYPEIKEKLENEQLSLQLPPPGFGWNSRYMNDSVPTVYYLTVPEDAFVRYSKDQDSSPATLPAVFMLRSVYAIHEEQLPVNAAIMANCRPALECSAFMGPCVSRVNITYPPKVRTWDIQKIATATRGAVILQTCQDSIRQKMLRNTLLPYIACHHRTGPEAKDMLAGFFVPEVSDSSMTIGCSYPGAIEWGELNQFINSAYAQIDPGAGSMTFTITVSAVGGHFCLALSQNFSSDVYAKQFCEEMLTEGILCTCSGPYPIYYAKTADVYL